MRHQRGETSPDERTDPVHQVMGPVPGGKGGAEGPGGIIAALARITTIAITAALSPLASARC